MSKKLRVIIRLLPNQLIMQEEVTPCHALHLRKDVVIRQESNVSSAMRWDTIHGIALRKSSQSKFNQQQASLAYPDQKAQSHQTVDLSR
uniref:Uncharacterized protein n=1 Tax=Oryza glumipatula TaxID=40148 RepID=A0A0D9Z808_9ORYZ